MHPLLALAVCSPALFFPQDPGDESAPEEYGQPSGSDHHAQPRGDGDFVLHLTQLEPAGGTHLSGIVDPYLTPAAGPLASPVLLSGAFYRTDLHMEITANRSEHAAALVAHAHEQGYLSMLTVVGTPASNSPHPEDTENYWKYPPVDNALWANELVQLLQDINTETGVYPEYVKIWNEPERTETYLGTRAEFVVFFNTVLARLRDAETTGELPAGLMKYGGPGMADWDSTMDEGEDPVLFELIEDAAAQGLPLRFVSWHEYFRLKPASSLCYYEPISTLTDLAQSVGLPIPELFVDEWNIYPSAYLNEDAMEMDSHRGAATTAIFLATAARENLTGYEFFQLQDVDPQNTIQDLSGAGNGIMTRRGVKKPSYHVLELTRPMLSEPTVQVDYPNNEWAAGLYATCVGNRVRVVLANDPVNHNWIWSQGCRERGGEPGAWWNAVVLTAAQGPVNVVTLQTRGGLQLWAAQAVLEVIPLSQEAQRLENQPRTIRIKLADPPPGSIQFQWPAYCFDDTHNDPADYQDEIQPLLNWVETEARYAAYNAGVAAIQSRGGSTSAVYNPEVVLANPNAFANFFQVDLDTAEWAYPYYNLSLETERVAHAGLLNSQPATVLYENTVGELGISYSGGAIQVTLQPAGTVVFDFTY